MLTKIESYSVNSILLSIVQIIWYTLLKLKMKKKSLKKSVRNIYYYEKITTGARKAWGCVHIDTSTHPSASTSVVCYSCIKLSTQEPMVPGTSYYQSGRNAS